MQAKMTDLEAIFDELTPLLTYITGKVIEDDDDLRTALAYQIKQSLLEAWRVNNRTEYNPLKAAKHLRHAYTTFTSDLLYTKARNASREDCIRSARKSWEENKTALLTADALNALSAESMKQEGSGSEGEDYAHSPEYITRASVFKRSMIKAIRAEVSSVGRNLAEDLATRAWDISEKNSLRKIKDTEAKYFDELPQIVKDQVRELEIRFPRIPKIIYVVWAQKIANRDSYDLRQTRSSGSSTHSSPRDNSEPTTPEKDRAYCECPDAPKKMSQTRVSRNLSESFEKTLHPTNSQNPEGFEPYSEPICSSIDSTS